MLFIRSPAALRMDGGGVRSTPRKVSEYCQGQDGWVDANDRGLLVTEPQSTMIRPRFNRSVRNAAVEAFLCVTRDSGEAP